MISYVHNIIKYNQILENQEYFYSLMFSLDVIYCKDKKNKDCISHKVPCKNALFFRYFLLNLTTKVYILYCRALTFDINYSHLNL